MTRRRPSVLDRVLDRLVRMLPAEFRADFGRAIEADLDERRAAGDRAGMVRRDLPSLARAVVREHVSGVHQDAKYAWRMMRRTPGFTAMAIGMLACGTGLNAAMFSIVDAVLLQSPFIQPEEIVSVRVVDGDRTSAAIAPDKLRVLTDSPGPLRSIGVLTGGAHVLTGPGDPMALDGIECVTPGMFGVLGTPPAMGRVFGPADNQAGAEPVIVLSHTFWRQLGGSPAVVNSTITINRTPVTVVGVMPKGFAGPLARADVQGWLPMHRPVSTPENPGCRSGTVNVFARLQTGVAADSARLALPGFVLEPHAAVITDEVSTPFTVLMVAVTSVLLIACLNVGGLQMERALARRREMSVRLAIGASRGRLVRQLLTENLILSGAGALAGLVVAYVGLSVIVSQLPANLPYLSEIDVNGRVLAMSVAVAGIAGLIAGLLPLIEVARFKPAGSLASTSRASVRLRTWPRQGLIVVEIALSIVVLISAGLMLQTFVTLRPSDPGFDPAGKLMMPVRLRGMTPEAGSAFFTDLLDRIRQSPAIESAEGATYIPMGGTATTSEVTVDGRTRTVLTNYTTAGFLPMMNATLIAGRLFTDRDTRSSEPVIVVNQQLAQRLRPDGQVLGLRLLMTSGTSTAVPTPVERTIVGVVRNMRSSGIHTRFSDEIYVPYLQNPSILLQVVARYRPGLAGETALQLRDAVRALKPDLVVAAPRSIDSVLWQRLGTAPFGALLLGLIAALAVGLAAIGLMATMGWWVRQRTRELGVRIALGATARLVISLVAYQGLTLAAVGIGVGCLGAVALTRFLSGWIYGVAPLDPATFLVSAATMLLIAAIAIVVPVRRAASVDPVIALRTE